MSKDKEKTLGEVVRYLNTLASRFAADFNGVKNGVEKGHYDKKYLDTQRNLYKEKVSEVNKAIKDVKKGNTSVGGTYRSWTKRFPPNKPHPHKVGPVKKKGYSLIDVAADANKGDRTKAWEARERRERLKKERDEKNSGNI